MKFKPGAHQCESMLTDSYVDNPSVCFDQRIHEAEMVKFALQRSLHDLQCASYRLHEIRQNLQWRRTYFMQNEIQPLH